ncbi:hypothetical protein [Mycobacteroides salmoniphilum]|uniref:hypothetical protein n=1 Tax=Mycobacteroides salmoniphilum TaxID=404941 RepID=UPI000992AA6F|nr:hypothetical protein [Mycobacteroides salmoniphilum]
MRRIGRWAGGVMALCLGIAFSPVAHSDPGLDGLSQVDDKTFHTYSTYGAGGWLFIAPGGFHCRIMTYMRWSGPPEAKCWGSLPGVDSGENYAFAIAHRSSGDNSEPLSGVQKLADISGFETRHVYSYEPRQGPDLVDPSAYHLLPSGSKLSAQGPGANVTCGVRALDTICVVESTNDGENWREGFVLSPNGSHTI